MTGFDMAIGMTQAELDAISSALYVQLYPQMFTGRELVQHAGFEFTVSWDVRVSAVFDLSDPQAARAGLAAHLAGLTGPEGEQPLAEHVAAASESAAAFSFTYPNVLLTFSTANVRSIEVTIELRAEAVVKVSGANQAIDVYALSASHLSDPVDDWLLQNVIVPRMLTATQQIFGGVTIPAIELPGVALEPPVPFVQDGILIAIATLAGAGAPTIPPPGSFAWPGSAFFTLLSSAAFQALTAHYIAESRSSLSGSGRSGSHWAGAEWKYDLSIAHPGTTVQSDGTIALTAAVEGGASASVYFLYIPIGVGFGAKAAPGLSADLGLSVEGQRLVVTTRSVAPFEIVVYPSGSVPERITAAMLEVIVESIVAAFSPFVSEFLGGIRFASFDIPTYRVTVAGHTLEVTPTNLSTSAVAGMLALAGEVTIRS